MCALLPISAHRKGPGKKREDCSLALRAIISSLLGSLSCFPLFVFRSFDGLFCLLSFLNEMSFNLKFKD
jgi:hypothetical protein